MRTRIKMCGICSAADALDAVDAGADAIGLVFYASSKRAVSLEQAAEIARIVPPYVNIVGLFVDAEATYITEVLTSVALDELQFHGNETPLYCTQFQRRYTKAVPMNTLTDTNAVRTYIAQYPTASGFLLDAFGGQQTGGSGRTFDWAHLPKSKITQPLTIAGGLNADNVATLIQYAKPYAVDVSSGIENAPRIKSADKMRAFVQAVQHADSNIYSGNIIKSIN